MGPRPATARRTRRVLVAALGATLRGDDGFGPRLLARVARKLPAWVCGRDFGTHGIALVQALFDGFDTLIILDACRRGRRPGTLYTIRLTAESPPTAAASAHLTAPAAVLDVAQSLGVLPPEVWLIGCEPAGARDYVLGLSRPVRRAMPGAVRAVSDIIEGWPT